MSPSRPLCHITADCRAHNELKGVRTCMRPRQQAQHGSRLQAALLSHAHVLLSPYQVGHCMPWPYSASQPIWVQDHLHVRLLAGQEELGAIPGRLCGCSCHAQGRLHYLCCLALSHGLDSAVQRAVTHPDVADLDLHA